MEDIYVENYRLVLLMASHKMYIMYMMYACPIIIETGNALNCRDSCSSTCVPTDTCLVDVYLQLLV